MTKKEALIDQFGRTVANLQEVLEKIKSATADRDVFRDSAIQRFEIAFDVCWKTLKEKLREEFGVEAASPKLVFKAAFKQGIIKDDRRWLDVTDMRNETSRAYSEVFAEAVLGKLEGVVELFQQLVWTLKQ